MTKMSLFEGVGDEVVFAILFAACLEIIIIYFFWIKGIRSPEDAEQEFPQGNAPPVHNPHTCPICWGEQRLAVETNCGHLYCGECLHTLYQQNVHAIRYGISCPMCRQEVTILFQCFTGEERTSDTLETQRRSIREFVNSYNRSFSTGERSLWDQLRDVPILFRHFIRDALDGENMEDTFFVIRFCIMFAITVAYVLVPSDLLPEYVFGVIGLLDDVVVSVVLVFYIAINYRRIITNRPVDWHNN